MQPFGLEPDDAFHFVQWCAMAIIALSGFIFRGNTDNDSCQYYITTVISDIGYRTREKSDVARPNCEEISQY